MFVTKFVIGQGYNVYKNGIHVGLFDTKTEADNYIDERNSVLEKKLKDFRALYFVGKSGKLYYYSWIKNELAKHHPESKDKDYLDQLFTLGLHTEFVGGKKPYKLPHSFY